LNFLKAHATYEEICSISYYSEEKKYYVHILSEHYPHITIPNDIKNHVDGLLKMSKTGTEAYRKIIQFLIDDIVIWAQSTQKIMYAKYKDLINASFGNDFFK
jgi:hypothetical protein